jgi:antitoxin component HigA of HigAB toxin-antitoxin module
MTLKEVKTNIAEIEKLIVETRESISSAPNSVEAMRAHMDLEHLEQTLSLFVVHRDYLEREESKAPE